MPGTSRDTEEKLKLIEFLRETIKHDNELRDKNQIGDKFRFVRDRLTNLLDTLEKSIPAAALNVTDKIVLGEDEVLVYVYLYNAQGLQFRTWQNLVNPKVFYEYSVNRPIYGEKSHIESLLRSKANPTQHAYLTIAVKKEYVLKTGAATDATGNPLVKVKEGSLKFERVIYFIHQGHEYSVNEEGVLAKKN